MEAHPDSDFFFLEQVGGEQDFGKAGAKVGSPVFTNPGELAAERVGRGFNGGVEQIEEVAAAHAGLGARGEVVAEFGGDLFIGGALREFAVIVELFERTERGISVREPKENHFLENSLAMREPFSRTIQPVI